MQSLPAYAFPFISILLAVCLLVVFLKRRRAYPPYPPGPRPLPIIGNLRDLPSEKQSAVYQQWAREYGDLVHVSVFGTHMLFVNSPRAIKDLFDVRSSNYSDRSHLTMLNDLMDWDWSFGMMEYGPRWLNHRKMFQRQFKASEVQNFLPIQIRQAQALIRRLHDDPMNLVGNLRHAAAATIMKIVYGLDIAHNYEEDRYVSVAERALYAMAVAARPGAFMVDMLPFLKYVPAWFPGAGFQHKAAEWKRITYEMRDAPFDAVISDLASAGKASPSFVSNLMTDLDSFANETPEISKAEQIETIKGCAGLAYAAGAESMVSSLSSWLLAMVLYQDVQCRAQEELDRVLGGRLPTFEDRVDLPYIDAMVTETLRWNPVAPIGLPHMVTKDDVYNGYFIPKGTIIAGNSWYILHDPGTYPNPLEFVPERFLPDPKTGKPSAQPFPECAFGYGRRICPGRFMTTNSLFINIAYILTCFDIRPMPGAPKPTAKFTDGMISHPSPFKYSLTPRSERLLALIIHGNH